MVLDWENSGMVDFFLVCYALENVNGSVQSIIL